MYVRPHEKKNILISGVFVVILLALTFIGIFFLSKDSSLFQKRFLLYAKVDNAQNLKAGSFIQLKGIKIGSIEDVSVTDMETITITMSINEEVRKWIRQDSYIMFKTQGVLGDKFLEILGGSENSKIINSNDFIPIKSSPELQEFITKGEDIIVTSTRVLARLDQILHAIDPQKLDETFTNLNESSKASKKIFSSLSSKDLKSLSKSFSTFEKITNRIEEGPGTLHSLIYDQAISDDIKSLTGGANRSKVLKYFIRESIKKSEEK